MANTVGTKFIHTLLERNNQIVKKGMFKWRTGVVHNKHVDFYLIQLARIGATLGIDARKHAEDSGSWRTLNAIVRNFLDEPIPGYRVIGPGSLIREANLKTGSIELDDPETMFIFTDLVIISADLRSLDLSPDEITEEHTFWTRVAFALTLNPDRKPEEFLIWDDVRGELGWRADTALIQGIILGLIRPKFAELMLHPFFTAMLQKNTLQPWGLSIEINQDFDTLLSHSKTVVSALGISDTSIPDPSITEQLQDLITAQAINDDEDPSVARVQADIRLIDRLREENSNPIDAEELSTDDSIQNEENVSDQLERLAQLKNQGVIDEEEFQAAKRKYLGL